VAGVSLRQHRIKLCTFAYKFVSNVHHLNGIASSTIAMPRDQQQSLKCFPHFVYLKRSISRKISVVDSIGLIYFT
jgi:hypothetical protein